MTIDTYSNYPPGLSHADTDDPPPKEEDEQEEEEEPERWDLME